MEPKITGVAQLTNESGRKAAELVMERINNYQNPTKLILLEPKLHFRESVRISANPKEVDPQQE